MGLIFTNLPLIDVTIKLRHGLWRPSYNELAKLAGDLFASFPTSESSRAIETPPGPAPLTFDITNPLAAGLTFSGSKTGIIAILQPELLTIRWNKAIGPGSLPYPGFEQLKSALLEIVLSTESASGPGWTGMTIVNMCYTNFVVSSPSPPGEILQKYFQPSVSPSLIQGAKFLQEINLAWQATSSTDLRVQVAMGITRSALSSPVEGFVISTTAGQSISSGMTTQEALHRVHDELQDLFESIISPTAKLEWGYKGRN